MSFGRLIRLRLFLADQLLHRFSRQSFLMF